MAAESGFSITHRMNARIAPPGFYMRSRGKNHRKKRGDRRDAAPRTRQIRGNGARGAMRILYVPRVRVWFGMLRRFGRGRRRLHGGARPGAPVRGVGSRPGWARVQQRPRRGIRRCLRRSGLAPGTPGVLPKRPELWRPNGGALGRARLALPFKAGEPTPQRGVHR